MMQDIDKEIWKPVRGLEEYLHVSNHGRVKSLRREVNSGRSTIIIEEKTIEIKKQSKYNYTGFMIMVDGVQYTFTIGRLIYETFNNLVLDRKKVIVYKDGNRFNNYINNLKVITRRTIKQKTCNKTGYVGVYRISTNCYTASIVFEGVRITLHSSSDPQECHKVYQAAKQKIDEFDKIKIDILNNSRLNHKLVEASVKL